jgi:hypothetical protein
LVGYGRRMAMSREEAQEIWDQGGGSLSLPGVMRKLESLYVLWGLEGDDLEQALGRAQQTLSGVEHPPE